MLTAAALETAMWNMADKASLGVKEHEHLHAIPSTHVKKPGVMAVLGSGGR